MINEIHTIIKNPAKCNDRLIKFLRDQKCLYLLSALENNMNAQKNTNLLINQIVQKHKLVMCRSVFEDLLAIPYALVKGAVLSQTMYGKPYYRQSGDIDLLIAARDADYVVDVLKKNGFIQGKIIDGEVANYTRKELMFYRVYTHQLAPFIKKSNLQLSPFINFDINVDIMWGEADFKIDMNEFLQHTEETTLYDIKIRKLLPIYEFIALCLHHYKDTNSIYLLTERGLCLNEFLEIYYYLLNVFLDVEELRNISKLYNVEKYVFYMIYYANMIAKDERLDKILERLETEDANEILDCYGLNGAERCKWDISFEERFFPNAIKEQFCKKIDSQFLKKVEINKLYM